MKRILTWAAIATMAALLLTGCGGKPNPDAVAQCVVDKASPELATRVGRDMVLVGSVEIPRGEYLDCAGGWTVAFSKEARSTLNTLVPQMILSKPEFRSGAYGALLPAGSTPVQRKAVADLGLRLERFYNLREQALNCLKAPETILHMMADTDLPFATAVLGVRGGIGNPAQAQAVAQDLIQRTTAAAALTQTQSCVGEVDSDFRNYAAELQTFMEGTHPWIPGCKAVVDDSGTRLVCGGAKQAK